MIRESEDQNFPDALEDVLAGQKIPPGLSEEDQAILALTTDLARTDFSAAYGKRAALLQRLLEQRGKPRGGWLFIGYRFTNPFDPTRPPRPEFAAALYQRIIQAMKTTIRTRVLRYFALSVAMVAVIAAVLFLSPATRAFAKSIIRQFGGYAFVQATPQPDKVEKDMTGKGAQVSPEQNAPLQAEKQQKIKDQQGTSNITTTAPVAADPAAAGRMAGFSVLSPAYVPDGYTAVTLNDMPGGWSINHENGGVDARTNYYNQATQGFIVIEEGKYDQSQPRTVDRPQVTDITVRGQSGAWMPDNGGKSTLAWEENGITYLVVGNTISQDEALKSAESLGK